MDKFIWELQKINLIDGEMQKIWQLEKIANDLKTLAEVKRQNINK